MSIERDETGGLRHCPTCNDTEMVGICGAPLPGGDFCVLRGGTSVHVHYGVEDVASDWTPASDCPTCRVCRACGSPVRRSMFCEWCGTMCEYALAPRPPDEQSRTSEVT